MNRITLYSFTLALLFVFICSSLQGQTWNNTPLTYDKTDHPYGYKRHECAGGTLLIDGEPIGVIIGGRGSDRKALSFFPRRNYADVRKTKAPYELHHAQGVVYHDSILVMGMGFSGGYPNETPSANILAYFYKSDSFSTIGTVPAARMRGSASSVIDGDWVYYFSGLTNGHTGGWVKWVDRFNLKTGIWEQLPDAPRARDHSYAEKVGNKVYLIGGRNSNATNAGGLHAYMVDPVDVFDLTTLTWETSTVSIPTSRAGMLVTSRINGSSEVEMAIWGGETAAGALQSGDLVNMSNGSSFALPNLLAPLHATVLFKVPGTDSLSVIAGAYFEGNENEVTYTSYYQRFGTPDVFPVEWLSVKAENEQRGINIKWEVSEKSVNHYRVERKSAGSLWQIVGSVNSLGDGDHSYKFTDPTPHQGTLLNYRIVSTDYDGTLNYSRVMELGVDAELYAYPNPVEANGGSIQFSVYAEMLELIDAKGALVARQENSSRLTLNSEITPGLYFFRVFENAQLIYYRKVLVQ